MKLCLCGHTYRYACEQIMAVLFPEEKPEIVDRLAEGAEGAQIILTQDGGTLCAVTHLRYGGKSADGEDCAADDLSDPLAHDRVCQKVIKTSFYHAALRITGDAPPWGTLTGIRPAHLVTQMLQAGMSDAAALRSMERDYFVSPQRAALCVPTAHAALDAARILRGDELSLYVGIPFCPTRCAYCSFVSAAVERTLPLIDSYMDALEREIALYGQTLSRLGLYVKTLYIGGGTPTTLSAAQLRRLADALARHFDFSRLCEYTVEAGRADTIDDEKLRVLKECGVGRISINPQSMDSAVLRAIGRAHTPGQVTRAMEAAHRAGFSHINMDLIAGLPQDTAEGFSRSLDACLSMEPDNLTVHTLALKKGSTLLRTGASLPSAETVSRMLRATRERLTAEGFTPYYLYRQKYMSGNFENVGWSRAGAQCLYNIYMMEELHTVLSLGAGGSTKLVEPGTGRIERLFHCKYAKEYIERTEKIAHDCAAFEAFERQMRGKQKN